MIRYKLLQHFVHQPVLHRDYVFAVGDYIMLGPVQHWEGELTWMHELWSAEPKGHRCEFHESHQSEMAINPTALRYLGTVQVQRQALDHTGTRAAIMTCLFCVN